MANSQGLDSSVTPTRDEAVEAIVDQVEDVVLTDWFHHTSDPEASRRVVVRAVVSRMLASAPAPASGGVDAVAVKALEWSEQGLSHSPTWRAESSFGRYLVYMKPDNSWAFEPPGRFGGKVGFKSPNDAMAAAQSEHDQNIRSALSPAATSGRVDAVACRHEPYLGECAHCGIKFKDGRPVAVSPVATPVSIAPPLKFATLPNCPNCKGLGFGNVACATCHNDAVKAQSEDILAKVRAMTDEQVLAVVPPEEIEKTRDAFDRARAATPVAEAEPITALYTNWRGETAERTFIPHRVFFGSNEWHPEPQVLIEATDCEKGALRTFAVSGFRQAASSPAGGDVVELVAAIIDPEIWAIEQPIPTRGHVEDFHQRRRSSCELAQRIIAALSQSTSAGRGE